MLRAMRQPIVCAARGWMLPGRAAMMSQPASTAAAAVETEEILLNMGEALQEDSELAKKVAAALGESSHAELRAAWALAEGSEATPPTTWQLRRLAVLTSIPMIGFGFMDNFIMICAGDYIDSTLCFQLGLSTMVAAGIGNIISDVFGVATAGPIESFLRNLGVQGPGLSPKQMKLRQVLTAKYCGSAFGIALGCIIGMFPLIWPDSLRLWTSRTAKESSPGDSEDRSRS